MRRVDDGVEAIAAGEAKPVRIATDAIWLGMLVAPTIEVPRCRLEHIDLAEAATSPRCCTCHRCAGITTTGLRGARRQADGGDDVHFAYDASGARVRKVYAHGSIVEERIYLGEYEIFRRRDAGAPAPSFERQTLRLVDQQRCIAVVETRTIDIAAPPATRWRYQVTDHLGSSRMELDAAGSVIGYEEFHPYGTCAFRATDAAVEVSARRYRYTCHERDEETGFDRVGMRYYVPWLARWTSPDPAGSVDGLNLYHYVRNNPLRYSDPSGTDSRDSTAGPARHQLRTSGSGSGDPTSSGSVGSRGGATAATTPSIVRTTGPSGGTGTGALSILGLKEVFTESWDRTGGSPGDATAALRLPGSLHQDVRNASARISADAYKNGMHSWHAATNAAVAHRVGPVGVIPLFLAGVTHESPIDWGSFMAEQDSQGTLNHILDSLMDIVANIFGMLIGLLLPRAWAIEVAAVLGNHIPGPGDPNPLGLAASTCTTHIANPRVHGPVS